LAKPLSEKPREERLRERRREEDISIIGVFGYEVKMYTNKEKK
jgi:hypothetical protein